MSQPPVHSPDQRPWRSRALDRARPLDPGPGSRAQRLGTAVSGSLIPFLLVVYLSLKGGGYDEIVRSEVGIAIWWIVLVGAVVGVVSTRRIGGAGWVFLGVLAAYAVWTGLAASLWSESAERSVTELARVVMLLGVFAFALAAQGPSFLRSATNAIAAAITLIGLLALLSRLHPAWFPPNEVSEVLPSEQSRLSYPLTYWNAVATLIAMGIPLLLWKSSSARHVLVRALAAAAIPALVLASYFTLSRGGAGEAAGGLIVLFALHPRRLSLLPSFLLGGAGGAALIFAASGRNALGDGLMTQAAFDQGTEMLLITLAVCAFAGILTGVVEVAICRGRVTLPRISRRAVSRVTAGIVVAGVIVAVAIGLPSQLSDQWTEFKQPYSPTGDSARFASASGSGRYQWWGSAIDAGSDNVLTGIGPGTFEYWWARGDGGVPGFIRDAHSLYLESFGELGVVGMLLIVALVGGIVALGVTRTLRSRGDPERSAHFAAVTAAAATFAIAAAVDWSWEMTVLPVIFLLLGAGLIGPGKGEDEGTTPTTEPSWVRAGVVVIAVAALAVIAVPMLSAKDILRSQQQVSNGQLLDALHSAQSAADLEPFAATPPLQEALVREVGGDLPGALEAARKATAAESTNWRTWLVRSRIEGESGDVAASVESYREARSLNPRSPLFGE